MRITVPDDVEIFKEDESTSQSQILKEQKRTLQEEIRQIMKLPKPLSSFIVDRSRVPDTPEVKLQVLLKFTQFCREEVFPRQVKTIETIQSRSDGLHCQLVCQQQDVARLLSLRGELRQALDNLELKRTQAQLKHRQITDRLKETLAKLQDCCKNKTVGEQRTSQDLNYLDTKVKDLTVWKTGTSSKANYYSSQVKAQSDSARKYIKPLYLDKHRTVFLRSSLNDMRQNIEDLVQRVKTLKNQASELSDPNESLHDLSSVFNRS